MEPLCDPKRRTLFWMWIAYAKKENFTRIWEYLNEKSRILVTVDELAKVRNTCEMCGDIFQYCYEEYDLRFRRPYVKVAPNLYRASHGYGTVLDMSCTYSSTQRSICEECIVGEVNLGHIQRISNYHLVSLQQKAVDLSEPDDSW